MIHVEKNIRKYWQLLSLCLFSWQKFLFLCKPRTVLERQLNLSHTKLQLYRNLLVWLTWSDGGLQVCISFSLLGVWHSRSDPLPPPPPASQGSFSGYWKLPSTRSWISSPPPSALTTPRGPETQTTGKMGGGITSWNIIFILYVCGEG